MSTEEKLVFRNRPLMEYVIDTEERDDTEEMISWLEQNATAPHIEEDEFFLWIPPFAGHKRSLRTKYGDNIPDYLKQLLLGAIYARRDEEDQGYLLIAFI
jgi:hypothetical protein